MGVAPSAFGLLGNLGCYALALLLLDTLRPMHTAQIADWRVVAVVIAMSLQAFWLVWMRRKATSTFAASILLWGAAVTIGGYDPLAVQPGVLLACFVLGTERRLPSLALALGLGTVLAAGALLLAASLYGPDGHAVWTDPLSYLGWSLLAIISVVVPATFGAWYARVRDHAERIAAMAYETIAGEPRRTADVVAADRRTIAQELHDVSSTHLAALLAHARAAEDAAPAEMAEQFRQVRHEGEQVYQGFEQLVNRMRQEDRTVTDEVRPRTGQHSVAQLGELVAEHRMVADVAVELSADPGLAEIDHRLGPMRSHIAYRVVQESLTNARRHAPGAPILVLLEDDGGSVLIAIENEAPPGGAETDTARGPSLGFGLAGMRDRLAGAGGSLRTGQRHGGGWSVTALLPHPPHRGTPAPRAVRETFDSPSPEPEVAR